jgi:hypothetical protein
MQVQRPNAGGEREVDEHLGNALVENGAIVRHAFGRALRRADFCPRLSTRTGISAASAISGSGQQRHQVPGEIIPDRWRGIIPQWWAAGIAGGFVPESAHHAALPQL